MIELLEENIGSKLDISLDCKLLGLTPKAKIDKWDYIKLKSFCMAKDIINKTAAKGMGENICKPFICLGVNIQNILY